MCTLDSPIQYVSPENKYKKILLIIQIIPEIITFFLVLPFLDNDYSYSNSLATSSSALPKFTFIA